MIIKELSYQKSITSFIAHIVMKESFHMEMRFLKEAVIIYNSYMMMTLAIFLDQQAQSRMRMIKHMHQLMKKG